MKRLVMGILAHVDAGKTTLCEGILYTTGTIRKLGRVDSRDAFLDTYALERVRGITIFSKQAVFSLGDMSVTLLDTPGHVDFSAEMERTLQVLDYAVLVINGADGVQGHTETLWRLLKRYRIPVFIFVNKMDQAGTDREYLLAELKRRFGEAVVDFTGLAEQLAGEELKAGGAVSSERLEELSLCGEALLEEYLERESLSLRQLKSCIKERRLFPCYFGSALKLTGVDEFLKGIEVFAACPAYEEAFGAKVFKISRDGQGSRLTHMKITGGVLKVKEQLGGPDGEKINQLRIYSGAKFETAAEAGAGMICAAAGPVKTRPGQGFGAEAASEQPLLEPVLTYQVVLPAGLDVHTALKALRELEEEDPLLYIIWDEALGELQAKVMGDVQMEILKSQMKERFGMEIGFGSGSIVYKETIRKAAEGVGHFEPLRHYAEVHLLLEPGEPGSGLQFETACSEDMLDRNWQRLILTHLEEKRHRGVLTGSEITDMKITLIAGRAHIKHTEGGDFRQATYRAVRQGLMEAGCRLLEPFYSFRLEIPSESLGRAMADMERMQGNFAPPVQEGDTATLTGSAPVAAMRDYQREVAAYTRGRGRLFCSLKGYEPCRNEEEAVAKIGYDFDLDLQNPAGSVFCAHGAGFTVPWNEVKRHMHVESPLKRSQGQAASLARVDDGHVPAKASGGRFGAGLSAGSRAARGVSAHDEEKELEEIFIRTYGEQKRRNPPEAARRIIRAEKPAALKKNTDEETDPEEEYLLVDGYNIIFAWEELQALAETNIDGARYRLMDILCNYQAYRRCTLIVVFDAYKVVGGIGEALKYHNIHVVYTKEAETADQYIEKLAHKIGRRCRVTVATSDGLEQLIIRGQGCVLLSAGDLKEEVERVRRLIETEKGRHTGRGTNYLLSHADEETREYLERVRLGEGRAKNGSNK
ncbi:MAG: GTP-binding protein [Lachnospiraceae bacterium]|nr:GTP-binding protein [Lachnospiraceae bacterium]